MQMPSAFLFKYLLWFELRLLIDALTILVEKAEAEFHHSDSCQGIVLCCVLRGGEIRRWSLWYSFVSDFLRVYSSCPSRAQNRSPFLSSDEVFDCQAADYGWDH